MAGLCLLRKNKKVDKKDNEEDYKHFIIAVIGNDLFYLKKCVLDLNDNDIYNALVDLEKKFLLSLERKDIKDTVDILDWYLGDMEYNVSSIDLKDKDEILKELQRIRKMIETTYADSSKK